MELLGAPLGPLERHLGLNLALLGASWLHLGPLLTSPWVILAHLGVLGALLEASWCHIDHPELHLGSSGSIFDLSGHHFELILMLF